jgi:hypothetical protein
MNILTLFVNNLLISARQFPDETPAAAARLDSEQRSLFGTASTSISVQPVARISNSEMLANQLEAMSTSERRREMVNLQAVSSPPPTKLPAALPPRTLEVSPATVSLAAPSIPIGIFNPVSISNGVPTSKPVGIVIGQPSFVLNPVSVFNGVPTSKPVSVVIGLPSIILNPVSVSDTFPTLQPVSVSASSPTLSPYPVSVPNGSPTIVFGTLNVVQVRFDCLACCGLGVPLLVEVHVE